METSRSSAAHVQTLIKPYEMSGLHFESKRKGHLERKGKCHQVADRKRLLLVAFIVWSQVRINSGTFADCYIPVTSYLLPSKL